MKIQRRCKKIRKVFFFMTVKSPLTVLLIIFLTISSLLYIACNNYTGTYVTAVGTPWQDNFLEGKTCTIVELDTQYSQYIKKDNEVIWYTNDDGKRYNAIINEVNNLHEKDKLQVIISASVEDVKVERAKAPTIEVFVGKVRIFNKLFNLGGN